MKNLSAIIVKELSRYTDSLELKKFIATLQSYNISTMQDLQDISVEEFCNYRGVGDKKIAKLQSLKTLLEDNIEQIQSEEEFTPDEPPSFSNQTIEELKVIPIDYLTLTLTEEKDASVLQSVAKYAKVKNVGELCMLSNSTLMNTPSLGKTKVQRVTTLQERLQDEEYREKLVKGYQDSLIVHNLPSSCSESLAFDILQFIREYVDLHNTQKVQDITAHCVELILLHGYTVSNAARRCKKDQERVRQSIFYDTHPSFFAKLRQMVFGKISEYDKPRFILSEEFKEKLIELRSNVRSGMLKADFTTKIGLNQLHNVTHKNGVMEFLNKLLDFKVFSGEVHKTRVTSDYLIYGNINDVKKVWGLVFKTLDSFVKPYIKEELINLIHKKHPGIQESTIDTIVGIIESDKELFIVTQDGLATKYQLRWDALQTKQSRVERILYEYKKPLQRQDIEREYDRRLQVYGMSDPKNLAIAKSKNIFQLHEGGTWIWAEYADGNKTISLQSLIRQFVAQNQKFKIEEIMEHIRAKISKVNERSVKTLLTKYCISTSEGYYLDKKNKEDFSDLHMRTSADIIPNLTKIMSKNQEYTYDELCKLYGDKYKITIPKCKIRKTCDNPTVFVVIRGNSRRSPNRIKINPEWDGIYEVEDRKRGIQAEWKLNVREEMINKLRYSPGYEMERNELRKKIESFIPDNVNKTGVYKIFKDKIFIIKEKERGRGAIVALNINEWETEFKQQLANKESGASTCDYETNDHTLQDAQQKQLSNPRYDILTNSDEDLNNLCASSKSLISHNLQQLISDNMEIDDFDSVWSYMVKQMDISRGGVDNAYYRMLNMLYGYMFGSTTRTNRYYLWVEIRLNFEPYLKKLLSSKGFSIMKEVKNEDGKVVKNEKTLKDLINLCQFNKILPNRNVDCYISKCISNILSKRNYRGHNAEDTPNDTVIVQNIQKTITLYLYTSMQFMKMS